MWEQGGGAVGSQSWWQTGVGINWIRAAWTAPRTSGCSPADPALGMSRGLGWRCWDCREFSSVCASAGALHNRLRGWHGSRDVFLPVFPCGWNLVDRNPQVGKGKESLGQRECAKLGTNTEPRPQPDYKLPPCKAILAFAAFSLVINLLGTGGVSPRMP